MKRKIILAVAPIAISIDALPQGARCPLSPEEVATEAVRCAEAGASVVHLHVRDGSGAQTEALDCFDSTLRAIRSRSDILIQGSTGGLSTLTPEQRCVSLNHPLTQSASLNMGSVNLGDTAYVNTLPDIRYWCGRMRDTGKVPELEVFDLSMVRTAQMILDEGLIRHAQFNIGLGFEWALPGTWRALAAMVHEIERIKGASFGIIHHGMRDMSLLAAAVGMGANMIRVGYEDSPYIEPSLVAPGNEALTERAAALIRHMGLEVATPAEAARMLYIGEDG